MKPVVIIPALNPDEKLIALVRDLKKSDMQVIIVNDGSDQRCASIFETLKSDYQCEICDHAKNLGKGAALKTGIRYAALKYPECSGYVTADADGQHAPEDIFKVACALVKNQTSLILGSRDFHGKNIPFKSKWGNRITSGVFFTSTGQKCSDTQTGLRGIPKKFTEICLSVQGDKFEYEMNLLLEMRRNRIPLVNVPIATIYLENNQSSHFHPVIDSIRIYFNILKYSLSSLFSAVIDLSVFTICVHFVFGSGAAGILAATVAARLMSGGVNFLINKHFVFQSRENHITEARNYFALFCCQMILSWFLVSCLRSMPLNLTIIKILVDTILFFISYQIQNRYIFKKKGVQSKNENFFFKAI